MLIVVTGSRSWTDIPTIREKLLEVAGEAEIQRDITLVHGTAPGADRICAYVAKQFGWNVQDMPADWEKYGRSAGYRRNTAMLDLNPDVVVAFWDGESKGTKHTIDQATKRGMPVEVVTMTAHGTVNVTEPEMVPVGDEP